MLTDEGARVSSVAIGTDVLDLGNGHATVRAKYGTVGQIYYMEKAEFENYDHGTDLAAHQKAAYDRQSEGVTVTAMGPTSVPAIYGGGRITGAFEHGTAIVRDDTSWIEHRAWLRADSSVFFVYVSAHYDIATTSGGTTTHRPGVGVVEIATDRAGALELGIPLETLQSVVPASKTKAESVMSRPCRRRRRQAIRHGSPHR